jgi:hypothetical protein
MKAVRACMFRLAGMFDKERREKEMAEEIESHLEMHTADNLRAGMTPEQARREALLRLGGVESLKEAYREGVRRLSSNTWFWISGLRSGNCGRAPGLLARRCWCSHWE